MNPLQPREPRDPIAAGLQAVFNPNVIDGIFYFYERIAQEIYEQSVNLKSPRNRGFINRIEDNYMAIYLANTTIEIQLRITAESEEEAH
jgi:hypothetical protein